MAARHEWGGRSGPGLGRHDERRRKQTGCLLGISCSWRSAAYFLGSADFLGATMLQSIAYRNIVQLPTNFNYNRDETVFRNRSRDAKKPADRLGLLPLAVVMTTLNEIVYQG
jgi:hypothetical protein